MSGKDGNVAEHGRRDRLIKERIHDPYMARSKPSEPTVCPECGVVFSGGRWKWLPMSPAGFHEELCPACQRIHDRVPAGVLTLRGEFFDEHRGEIVHLVQNKIDSENAEHPMKRLMEVCDKDDGSVEITFTDVHLPRGVGEAIKRAYEGNLDIQYTDGAGPVRVYWER